MEQTLSSVKPKKGLAQVRQSGPHHKQNHNQSLFSLWHSHHKSLTRTLFEKEDTPRVQGVTESSNIQPKKFEWNPLRKVETGDNGSLGNTKRFSKTQFSKEDYSTDFPSHYPKPVKGKGMATYRIKKTQLMAGMTFTKRCRHCMKSGFEQTHVEGFRVGDNINQKGIQVCQNVWECASCRPYLQWKMRNEISQVYQLAKANGEYQSMITLTINHNRNESLLYNVNLLNEGWNSLRNDRQYKELMSKTVESSWSLRTIEVTYGEKSGWHPHFHILLSGHNPVSRQIGYLKERITDIWTRVISRIRNRDIITGSNTFDRWSNEKTVVVSEVNDLVADYFVKWSMKDELSTGLTAKGAKNGNWSIGDLEVEMTKQYESTGQIEPWIRKALTEFYTTMKGRKYNTKTGRYKEYLTQIDEEKKEETEVDEEHNNISGYFKVTSWFYDEILHKNGIVWDFWGEFKNRALGEDLLGLRDWLLYELWKVMRVPIRYLECMLDTNFYIETREGKNKTGFEAGFSV